MKKHVGLILCDSSFVGSVPRSIDFGELSGLFLWSHTTLVNAFWHHMSSSWAWKLQCLAAESTGWSWIFLLHLWSLKNDLPAVYWALQKVSLVICVVIDYIRTLYTFYVQQLAVQLFVSHWEAGHIYRHVSPNLRPQKVLCQLVFLSSGSQKIATICAMNLHPQISILWMRRVVHQAKAHQSPVPNVRCQILHVAEPLRNSINCVNCASCACPFTVIVCRLDGWDWLGQAALLRSACIELVGDKSHGLINSHHSRGFDKVWPVASSCSTGIICNQCPSPVWNNWNVARTPTSPTRPWMANDESRWSWRYNSSNSRPWMRCGYIKYHQITTRIKQHNYCISYLNMRLLRRFGV